MNLSYTPSSTFGSYSNPFYQDPLIHPATHTPSTIKISNQQPFNINQIQPIVTTEQQQVQDRITLNKLRRIDLRYKQQQQKQNWLLRHKSKMKKIQSNMQNKNKMANRIRQYNILSSMQVRAEKQKLQKQMSIQFNNKFQLNQEKHKECRQRANLKKNQYIFRIHNKTCQKFQMVNKRKEKMLRQRIQQSKRVHLQEWYNYKDKLLRKYQGKQLRDPAHLYQEHKDKEDKLKEMLKDIYQSSQEEKKLKNIKKPQKTLIKTKINKFVPNKLSYFGINSQKNLQIHKKDLQKMKIFLDQEHYCQNQEEKLVQKFKDFILSKII